MNRMESMKTINDIDFRIDSDYEVFNYQKKLTAKLDAFNGLFNQETINEIVLWKVNRYAELSEQSLSLLNKISSVNNAIDETLTKDILHSLLPEPGIRLPMASTILRFKNPNIYQIIDQRVYRIIYGKEYRSSYSENGIDQEIELYLCYLRKLREVSEQLQIDFSKADRILYNADKELNKEIKIKY